MPSHAAGFTHHREGLRQDLVEDRVVLEAAVGQALLKAAVLPGARVRKAISSKRLISLTIGWYRFSLRAWDPQQGEHGDGGCRIAAAYWPRMEGWHLNDKLLPLCVGAQKAGTTTLPSFGVTPMIFASRKSITSSLHYKMGRLVW